jgi:ribosomal protein L37AE/L43A
VNSSRPARRVHLAGFAPLVLGGPGGVSHTGQMLRRPTHVTRRRVAAHACPECRRLWALRGERTDTGTWLIRCSFCGWHDVRGALAQRSEVADPGEADVSTARWSHGVLLYSREDELLDVLEDYLVTGWDDGGVGLVIATPEHRRALHDRLAARGLTGSLGEGRFVELDARSTLDQFMRDGSPDAEQFDRTVGSLVRDHAAGATLRGFGEMVDVLWAEGNAVGALELERLWTALGQQVEFSLLCAYATAHVDPRDREVITDTHDHVLR